MRSNLKYVSVAFSSILMWSFSVQALPAYTRLYQTKYGYRASCVLCHSAGGGSAVNNYGRDFLRAGANFQAFAKIESLDSDKDGFRNLDEISKKSNPGDARSTPQAPGDWVADQNKISIPEKDLRKLFVDAESFSAVEGTLKENQVKEIEALVGANLNEEDKVPTFYFAIKGAKKFAIAQFVSVSTAKGPVTIAVAVDISGAITSVRILKNPLGKSIEDPNFLSQFIGKTKVSKWELKTSGKNKDEEEQFLNIIVAVKKAVFSINSVFSK